MDKKIWIGLVNIKPLSHNEYIKENERAYTNILLYASDLSDFKEKAEVFFLSLNFEILEFDEVDIFEKRSDNLDSDNSVAFLSKQVELYKTPQISTLYTYDRGN